MGILLCLLWLLIFFETQKKQKKYPGYKEYLKSPLRGDLEGLNPAANKKSSLKAE